MHYLALFFKHLFAMPNNEKGMLDFGITMFAVVVSAIGIATQAINFYILIFTAISLTITVSIKVYDFYKKIKSDAVKTDKNKSN